MKKLLVIDGNSILNRAFYGIRPLTNSAGLHTNALFGVLNILQKQMSEVKPDYAAIAFDLPAPTFRHKEYAEYKAGRKKMPEELAMQLPYSKRLAEALGFKVISLEGYEADDLLGTVSAMAKRSGVHSYILTGDRDSLQLIDSDSTVLLATNSDTVPFDRDAFFEKYGVEPSEFIDVKALMGDSSDNIPGVPGIGEKTALKLIAEFKSIDNVYENIENAGLGKSAKQKMLDGKELAYLSRRLATIERSAPVDLTLEGLAFNGMDRGALYTLLQELEFTSHIKRLGLTEADVKSASIAPVTVETPMTAVSESGQLSFEIEAASYGRRPVSVCPVKDLKKRLSSRYALVYDGTSAAFCDENNCFEVYFSGFGELCDTVSRIGGELIVYDCKKMISDFKLESRTVKVYDDVMLMAYVADPARSGYELFDLAEIYLKTSIEETLSDKAFAVYGLHERLTERLERENMLELYRTVELPLAEVLADMESAGFMLDIEALQEFLQRLCKTEAEYTERIYVLAGHEFNINSPKQLGTVLFEELGLTAGKKTKTGYSTGADILEKLRAEHEIVGEILDYRAVAKLRSTYAEALLKLADKNGRVHTVFSQTTAVTGRLASSEPNLQNIPVRTELGREMRRFFVASSPDRVLIDADYSQIELRLLAHIARDETMINAFISGEDIHTVTASQVFGVPISEVTGEMRKRAKAVNFGIVYGIGEFSLAQDIGVSRKEAGEYINNYFAKYGGIATYLSAAVEAAKTLGFVETIFGRRRYIPELTSGKAMLRAFGERVAMNSPIQGSSADIIKLAMINVHKALKAERIDARLILQIHDELIVEADRDQAEEAAEILRREMENVVKLSVPLTVELQTGNSWFDCK